MMTIASDSFTFDRGGRLVRRVVPRRGQPYQHVCTLDTFTKVAHACDELGDVGTTLEELARREDLPFTQVAVALAFMKDRGCLEVECRRSYPASGDVHVDAMIEWHALREKGGVL